MTKTDKSKIRTVEVFIADGNEAVRDGLRSGLRAAGFKRLLTFSSIEALTKGLQTGTPDFLIVAGNLGTKAFRLVKDVRKGALGRNPFLMVTLLLGNTAGLDQVRRALSSGADDIITGPIAPGVLLERISFMAFHRPPFISTTDYLGPERRRRTGRKSQIPQMNVINTLRDKIEGRRMSPGELNRAIRSCQRDVMAAQLESQGRKLDWACKHIIGAYKAKTIDVELKKHFLVLIDALDAAAVTAGILKETEVKALCLRLAQDVRTLSENYKDLADSDLAPVRKLAKAYGLARTSKSATSLSTN
jgi:DNA-binding response OmpR family regulator